MASILLLIASNALTLFSDREITCTAQVFGASDTATRFVLLFLSSLSEKLSEEPFETLSRGSLGESFGKSSEDMPQLAILTVLTVSILWALLSLPSVFPYLVRP